MAAEAAVPRLPQGERQQTLVQAPMAAEATAAGALFR